MSGNWSLQRFAVIVASLSAASLVPSIVHAEPPEAPRVTSLALGSTLSAARLSNGRLLVWGSAVYSSVSRDGKLEHFTPFEIPGVTNAQKVAVGDDRICALDGAGAVTCWGRDWDAWRSGRHSTAPIVYSNVVDVTMSGHTECFRYADGGGCAASQMGPAQQAVSNDRRTCIVRTNGTALCQGLKIGREDEYWPREGYEPAWTDVPREVKGITNIKVLRDSGRHVCAVVEGGDVYCIGFGEKGQLGNGKYGAPYAEIVAVKALDLKNAVDLALGDGFSCARTREREVWCWGANTNGELGLGDNTQRTRPTRIPSLTDVIAIAAASDHACAVRANGEVLCWGSNVHGQLGTGDRTGHTSPVRVKLN